MTARPRIDPPAAAPRTCAAMCADDRDGHAVTLLRLRLAHLDPTGWVDAVVLDAAVDGTVRLRHWADEASITVWHHVARTDLLPAGTPVALHTRRGVLAVGSDRLNVALR